VQRWNNERIDMVNALLFIIVILLICTCLFLSQILWQNEQYHLENKKKLSADILDARNERMTSMVHSQFYMNLFWSVIFAVVIFLILVGLDKFDLINIFN
tara:strand:+ start:344 stop:643 length:300 start_codon:yes stop_codon:yes gene_type:complete